MDIGQQVKAIGYPHVQGFIVGPLHMQFSDVRAMLMLPRPEVGINTGCNFTITSELCSIISGVSTTIYKPTDPKKKDSADAFKGLVQHFFPYTPLGTTDFPGELYGYARNPLTHSAGIMDAGSPKVVIERLLDQSHPATGWSDKELNDLEAGTHHFPGKKGIVVADGKWTLYPEPFYLEVIEMLRRLVANKEQMQAAEDRFKQGKPNWRRN
jgi:hypothetical protein